jgi:hypothetical protein
MLVEIVSFINFSPLNANRIFISKYKVESSSYISIESISSREASECVFIVLLVNATVSVDKTAIEENWYSDSY